MYCCSVKCCTRQQETKKQHLTIITIFTHPYLERAKKCLYEKLIKHFKWLRVPSNITQGFSIQKSDMEEFKKVLTEFVIYA